MSNLHRIQWIDAQIRAKRYPNCRDIGETFEISTRQASRDIEYMRYSMGAPVEYSAERNGYFYTNGAYVLPNHFITEDERDALNYLAHHYRAAGGDQAAKLAELFSKLTGTEDSTIKDTGAVPVYSINSKVVELFSVLKKAVESRSKVGLHYINAKNEVSKRLFSPYKLFTRQQVNYVVGFCELKNEIRVFRLERIRKLEITKMNFVVSPYFNEKEYGSEAPFNFKSPYICKMKADRLLDFGRLYFSIADSNAGIYEVEFYNSEEILNILLSQASRFSILSPNWLKDKLRDRLNDVFNNNFS